ncbi:MAG: metallophosphoesterase [Paenibacillaceae bacterium]|jgi:predicted MPP superfamily phosphohydrolase|nr:metallophosphoesterase [Paenibacillaceae bacterium]
MFPWEMLIGLAAAGYGLLIVPTQWLKVEQVNHSLGLHKRIVQISDLHVEKLRISPERLERTVREARPDYIFISGDFTRNVRYLPRLNPYLKSLTSIGVPVYAVLGNHDYKLKAAIGLLLDLLRSYGVRVLRNEAVRLDTFWLAGIDDFGTGHSKAQRALPSVRAEERIVVLTHDPNVVPHIRRRFDYLMSGHLHGKQFNIPFFFKLKSKGELPSKGIYKGFHRCPQGPFYISKGIGQAGINARLFVRSEITVHHL